MLFFFTRTSTIAPLFSFLFLSKRRSIGRIRKMTSAATTHARPRSPSPPRERPRAQPEDVYGDDVLVEEEAFSWYDPDEWYPVKIGDVFESRYQVLLKLGFGSVSTAWLCRDLK